MFFYFRQNNSGGTFVVDSDVDVYVFIEATNEDSAYDEFQMCGGYFNGVKEGLDCPCCGDRWRHSCYEVKINVELSCDSRAGFNKKYPRFTADSVIHMADRKTLYSNCEILINIEGVLDKVIEEI